MAKLCAPVVILTGITGNYLRDAYPLPPDLVWSALTRNFERVQLHPDNTRYEAQQPARIVADQPIELVYKELVEELRHNLCARADKPVPVYVFPYDWRQPLEPIEDALHDFIDEVIERTKLLKHYFDDGFPDAPSVNLVGHSMGGLIIAGYLARYAKKHRVAKVATIATPFRGSIEPVAKMTSGLSNLTGGQASSREREASRVTPALYYLLPTFDNCLIDSALQPISDSIFDPSIWQPSVLDTIKEYVRLYGVSQKGRADQAAELFRKLLDDAAGHDKLIRSLKLSDAGLDDSRWLCIAGADRATRVCLKIEKLRSANQFTLDQDCAANDWGDANPVKALRTGDGTVPLPSALPPFLRKESVICVRPKDYAWSEVGDTVLANENIVGFHGNLPNMNLVQRLIVRHFLGLKDVRSNTWGSPAPGVSASAWSPPMALDMPT